MGLAIGILIFGSIVASLPVMALDYVCLRFSIGQPPVILVRVIVGLCAIGVGWFFWRLLNRVYWRLTEVELIGGRQGDTRLPLASLQKIVIGLPNKFAIPGIELFASPRIRGESVLLCFSDGSIFPMHLHGLPSGSRLMGELISRFSARVDQHYIYSDEEIRILRKADINVLIKKNLAA